MNKNLERIRAGLFVVCSVLALVAIGGKYSAIEGAVDSTTPTPGVWNKNFTNSLAYAEANHIPVLMYYGSTGCGYCSTMAEAINLPVFQDWRAEHPIILVYKHPTPDEISRLLKASSAEKCFDPDLYLSRMWVKDKSSSIPDYPRLRIWWRETNGTEHNVSFVGRDQAMPVKKPSGSTTDKLAEKLIASLNLYVGAYEPMPTYAGGYFVATNAPYASLEAEKTTSSVDVEMSREVPAMTNQNMVISYSPDVKGAVGCFATTVTVAWAENQFSQTYRIENFKGSYFAEGRTVRLALLDADGKPVSETAIACATPKNSSGNPNVTGCSQFGVWTMDLDAAKEKVRKTSGKAYALVCIQGSLWCPDCVNVEENFLNLEDERGNNRFAAWAESNHVALVTIDIPNYRRDHLGLRGPDGKPINDPYMSYETFDQDIDTPCLLSRKAFKGNRGDALCSGIGYLTRKGLTDEEARRIWERNWNLVWKNTEAGGLHRPEDLNKNRTGVPVFVLLDKDGKVRARLTRMADKSPTAGDQTSFEHYLKRFDEMLWIADNNQTEIENNYPSAGSVVFKANGGSETATISHTDLVDTFLLDGVGGNALQRVTVTTNGIFDAEVRVTFFSTNEQGVAELVGESSEGWLSKGIELTQEFGKAGAYFVQVEAKDPTSEAFAIDNVNANHFIAYKVSGVAIAIPQEDRATSRPPEGADVVMMRLRAQDDAGNDIIYRIEGMAVGGCEKLVTLPGQSIFFKATASGDFPVTLERADGALTYQIWKPGSVGFSETVRTVTESVCDTSGIPLFIKVQRTGGTSGAISSTVTVDRVASTFDPKCFWFGNENDRERGSEFVEVKWEDGHAEEKTFSLYVADDVFYDGDGTIVLNLATDGGEAGDVEVPVEKSVFALTVIEDDKRDPGKAFFAGTNPTFARKGVVYANETKGVKIRAVRTEGFDGLIAGILKSSVAGTKFSSDDPRDIDLIENVMDPQDIPERFRGAQVLYWASREDGEKWVTVTGIPAGKTAKISFTPVNMGTIPASNTVTVISIKGDAPGFASAEPFVFYRGVTGEGSVAVTGTNGVEVSFLKVSGTLPAGLKAGYEEGKLTVSGITTAKAGVYQPVYQVRERRGGELVVGETVQLTLTVRDLASEGPKGEPAVNPSVAKARTFKDVAVLDAERKRLVGLVQLAIPSSGKLSAKYTSASGTVSFASRGWSGISGEDNTLQAQLVSRRAGYSMEVAAGTNSSVSITLYDPAFEQPLVAGASGPGWSKDSPATPWQGYYTVAVRPEEVEFEDSQGIAPSGYGYLTLKMNTAQAARTGTFKIAGMLPNGTKISGSSVLSSDGWLPVFKRASKDLFAAVAEIAPDAIAQEEHRCIKSPESCVVSWVHTERSAAKGSYGLKMKLYGGYFLTDDLAACCSEFYKQTELNFYAEWLLPVTVKLLVADKSNWIDPRDANTPKLTFAYNRLTGVVTGTFLCDGARVRYAGVVVNGWGDGCGCSEGGVYLPLVSGSAYQTGGVPPLAHGSSIEVNR